LFIDYDRAKRALDDEHVVAKADEEPDNSKRTKTSAGEVLEQPVVNNKRPVSFLDLSAGTC
jgi:hypothetical protein